MTNQGLFWQLVYQNLEVTHRRVDAVESTSSRKTSWSWASIPSSARPARSSSGSTMRQPMTTRTRISTERLRHLQRISLPSYSSVRPARSAPSQEYHRIANATGIKPSRTTWSQFHKIQEAKYGTASERDSSSTEARIVQQIGRAHV